MNTFTRYFAVFTLAASAFVLSNLSSAKADFLVLVNADNKFSGDDGAVKAQVRRLYLKEIKEWPGGIKGAVFARKSGSGAQEAFMKTILGLDAAGLDSHWKKLKQTTGDTPPRAVSSARIVLRQVSKNPGGLAVVEEGEVKKIPSKVRVLMKFGG